MNTASKHINLRLNMAKLLASMSSCPRGQVGAVIFNPESNTVVSDGYNGPPRGAAGTLCGGHVCERKCASGTEIQIGCHHAEMNAICNAARNGASTLGMSLAVTCEPCLMCAKLIHHAGINKVYFESRGYSQGGIEYLAANGVELERG